MSDKDIQRLADFDVSLEDIKKTANIIEADINLRPFEKKYPIFKWLGFRLVTILSIVFILYFTLLLIQLALFNIIMLVVAALYINKIYLFMIGYEVKREFNYKTKDFKKFLE